VKKTGFKPLLSGSNGWVNFCRYASALAVFLAVLQALFGEAGLHEL
jgi:hypothetical protein